MTFQLACMGCFDSESDSALFRLPCEQHAVCTDCLREMVELAVTDESSYPLGCGAAACPNIPVALVQDVLSNPADARLLETFAEKVKEYAVPAQQRTYCASTECCVAQGHSRYLDAEMFAEGTRIICPDCSSVTCTLCKSLRSSDAPHCCKTDDHDQVVKSFVKSVPEDERWLWQKCYQCGSWVEKLEACNHMSCRCSAEFCLVCGRRWEGLASCRWGCPKYERPVYDEDGFNQNGYNPTTGLDREGMPWDPNHEHEHGDDDWYDGYYEHGFDQDGYDLYGFDPEGFDRDGFNRDGRDREGYDEEGFNDDGRDRDGYDRNGRGLDGFFDDGCDMDGFDRDGISLRNLPREFYDDDGFDPFGYDVWGYSPAGYDYKGYDVDGYNADGYNGAGYDIHGFDKFGWNSDGFDRRGRDHEGYSFWGGYSRHHRTREGELEPGFAVAPDGNVRRILYEGPTGDVMECAHSTYFVRAPATCVLCRWGSNIFHHRCEHCGIALCRACDGGAESIQRRLREQYLWPGTDSYGIDWMLERAEQDNDSEKREEKDT